LFERLAIDVLLECGVEGATRILDVSWDEAWHIEEKAVKRGRAAKPSGGATRLGVDETAIAKGQRYATLVYNLDESTVEYVAEDRKQASLDGYFEALDAEQLAGIEAVAMDMWAPYVNAVQTHVPDAANKIVFDRYHIMKHVNDAVNSVRRMEHRQLKAAGDDALTGSRYMWLYGRENLPERHQACFAELRAANLKTGRAWAIKETLRDLWDHRQRGWAERHWRRWYFWATHSRLDPVIKVSRMLKTRLHNVMTFFTHRITNAVGEGLNAKIRTIQRMARGFRNFEHFRTAVYFHCGGLPLYPGTH
jgi:transposase